MTINIQLPDLPSKALEQALIDLEAIRKDDRYIIEMMEWHKPAKDVNWLDDEEKKSGKCYVCMAGAVLARSGADPKQLVYISGKDESCDPNEITGENSRRLQAIDYFRMGWTKNGLASWYWPKLTQEFSEVPDVDITQYSQYYPETYGPFKNGILKMIHTLREHGY